MVHRAVVVGISDYGRLKQPLPGCANDMTGWQSYLTVALGLNPDSLRLLADARATKQAILERIAWLLAETEAGDERVFMFAGHGARLRRRNAATGVLQDKLDETIVAYPGPTDDYEDFMIFDEELAAIVDQSGFAEGARLTMVFDSCHSGGMLRDIIVNSAGFEADVPLPRSLRIPEDILARESGTTSLETTTFGSLERGQGIVKRLIIAAAQPQESAWDDRMDDGQRHGVFSYYALKALSAGSPMTAEQVIAGVSPSIGVKFPQHPMLLGEAERYSQPLFR